MLSVSHNFNPKKTFVSLFLCFIAVKEIKKQSLFKYLLMNAVKPDLNFNVCRANFQDMKVEIYSFKNKADLSKQAKKLSKMAY